MFGLNGYNFNMNSMMSFMPFMNSGCGSYGTNFMNIGSMLGFNCNGYNTPVSYGGYNVNGCGNGWGWGFGLAAMLVPVLGTTLTRVIGNASKNSNKNQRQVVANDIETLQGKLKTALDKLGTGVTKDNYKDYKVTSESWYTTEEAKIKTNILNDTDLASYKSTVEAYDNLLKELGQTDTTEERKTEINKLLTEQKAGYEAAKKKIEAHKKAEQDLAALNKKAEEKQAIKNKEIEKITELITQIKNAQAELDDLRLDKFDGNKNQRATATSFNSKLNVDAQEENGSTNYYAEGKKASDITEGDVLYIINQFRTSSGEAKTKYAKMLNQIWNDKELDPDIKNSKLCLGGYRLICEELKAHQ